MDRDHYAIFETASKYCISVSFVEYDDYSISDASYQSSVWDGRWAFLPALHSYRFTFPPSLQPTWSEENTGPQGSSTMPVMCLLSQLGCPEHQLHRWQDGTYLIFLHLHAFHSLKYVFYSLLPMLLHPLQLVPFIPTCFHGSFQRHKPQWAKTHPLPVSDWKLAPNIAMSFRKTLP